MTVAQRSSSTTVEGQPDHSQGSLDKQQRQRQPLIVHMESASRGVANYGWGSAYLPLLVSPSFKKLLFRPTNAFG